MKEKIRNTVIIIVIVAIPLSAVLLMIVPPPTPSSPIPELRLIAFAAMACEILWWETVENI
jgi:hypothetical protein